MYKQHLGKREFKCCTSFFVLLKKKPWVPLILLIWNRKFLSVHARYWTSNTVMQFMFYRSFSEKCNPLCAIFWGKYSYLMRNFKVNLVKEKFQPSRNILLSKKIKDFLKTVSRPKFYVVGDLWLGVTDRLSGLNHKSGDWTLNEMTKPVACHGFATKKVFEM